MLIRTAVNVCLTLLKPKLENVTGDFTRLRILLFFAFFFFPSIGQVLLAPLGNLHCGEI